MECFYQNIIAPSSLAVLGYYLFELEGKTNPQNVDSLDSFVSLGKSSVTKNKF